MGLSPSRAAVSSLGATRGLSPSAARAGVSLLEVLISIFVLSMGLLGIAAVIPVARFEIVEAAKADRSAAAGQALLDHAKVCGMLEPSSWQEVFDPTPLTDDEWVLGAVQRDGGGNLRVYGFDIGRQSYAIDPLYVATAMNDPDALALAYAPDLVQTFPYWPADFDPTDPSNPPPRQRFIPDVTMCRVTWHQQDPNILYGAATPVADRIARQLILSQRNCSWRDDLLVPVPSDRDQRPRQMMLLHAAGASPVVGAWPLRPGDNVPGALTPQRPEAADNYTWVVTATPRLAPEHYTSDSAPRAFSVSVVVFYKRNLASPWSFKDASDKPAERTVIASFLGGGYGGGDVRLVALPTPPDYSHYLDVKEGEWLMLGGTVFDPLRIPPVREYVFRWYRIAAAGETIVEDKNLNGSLDPGEDSDDDGVLDAPYRHVTLEGPDWNVDPVSGTTSWCLRDGSGILQDINSDGTFRDVQACLFDGVVGVFTTTVELD